nr:alpha-L-arabinofuranosidase C-terminal domain-containing protein [uncultured Treponema sp.]
MKITLSNNTKKFISEKMFGLFFEDINYAADGGLYAEMIENRQFAFRRSWAGSTANDYKTEYTPDYGWKIYGQQDCAEMEFIKGCSLCDKNPHYMKFTTNTGNAGFTNKAYDGVCLRSGASYNLKIWIRNPKYEGSLTVICKSSDGTITAAQKEIKIEKNKNWQMIEDSFTADSTIKNGTFIILQNKGTVDYGYISLMPADAVAGVFRKDLFELLKETRPGFLRFPGGCIVEGAVLSNRYNWKDTVGENWKRHWNWNRWATHNIYMWTPGKLAKYFPYYNQSYGLGFYEYFLLSELMGAEPLPVLSVGIACQFQTSEMVDIKSREFKDYIQSALDLIEFANGSTKTKWGKLRAKMGHENSFNLKFIGIGNEQWQTDKVNFLERYKAFEKAIHKKYPDIELIGTAGPDVTSEKYTTAWNFFNNEIKANKKFTAAIDEHYYMKPEWFYEHIHMYDSYSRDIPVFAGEYAAHTEHRENNLEAALAEAAFMTGLEKNCDVIRFASVAPLFARYNYAQWWPDFIWFDGDTSMATPGYYVQKLFGKYTGTSYIEHSAENAGDKIFTSVTTDGNNYFVKVVNAGNNPVELESIHVDSDDSISRELLLDSAKVIQLSGKSLSDVNVIGKEENVKLEEMTASKNVVIPGLSVSVFICR